MFERFTERARRVIILAREEAGRFRHDFVGTEHILLGLIRDGEGPGRLPQDPDLRGGTVHPPGQAGARAQH